jgi:colanic acid biosynthesis glycosyl transferase WcaI
MQFTILTQYYPPEVGAAQVRLSALAQELVRAGHTVQVVTAMPNYPSGMVELAYRNKVWVREQIDGVSVTRTWVYGATGSNVIKRLFNYFSFTVSCLLALLTIPRTEILFVESPPLFLCLSAWLTSVLRRQKLCINVSDLWPDSVIELGFMQEGVAIRAARLLERWLYRSAWRICGATEGIIRGIKNKGICDEKLLLLPNGVDINQFRMHAYELQRTHSFQLLYAGTHGYAHGVEVILRAAAELRNRTDIKFLLVGGGADKPRLQALATELQLPNLTFQDPIPTGEVPKLLTDSFAALVTVAEGNFFAGTRSAKIFPAMATGRAILHSGMGEGADLIKQAGCGIVTPAGNAIELAKAILELVDHPDIAITMGAYGRAFVESEYSWTTIVQRWLKELSLENPNQINWDHNQTSIVHKGRE